MILVTLASRSWNAELAMRAGFKSLPQRGLASKGLLRQRLAIEGSAEKVWGRVFDPPAKGGATYLFVRVRGALACARHPSDSRPSHRPRAPPGDTEWPRLDDCSHTREPPRESPRVRRQPWLARHTTGWHHRESTGGLATRAAKRPFAAAPL